MLALRLPLTFLVVWVLAALSMAAPAPPAHATSAQATPGASAWADNVHAQVRLISASDTAGLGTPLTLGLEFQLEDGWKIYWRSPGDAGYPPNLDWSGSTNLASADIGWPTPTRFTVLGMQTIGYKDQVVLPITANLEHGGESADLRLGVDYLACSEICVPMRADLDLALPAGPPEPNAFAHEIARATASVPVTADVGEFDVVSVGLAGPDDTPTLRVSVASETPLSAGDVLVEGPEDYAFGAPTLATSSADGITVFEIPVYGAEFADASLQGTFVTLTVIDGDDAIERRTEVGALDAAGTDVAPPAQAASSGLGLYLLLGVLGGLILNLMPCVLPVLSIKILSVVGHGGAAPAEVRRGFLASAAGIIFSFLILAASLITMKSAGAAIGWGVQFQQPWFLVAMVLVVSLFAANLWGLFEIHLPQAVADAGARIGHGPGLGGHFLTGMLATLLATPCSAPFLGTAVGFALARGAGEIVAIFLAIGVGLALPYLAVAAVPRIATRMPRPGNWMIVLRRVLAVALAGTALWLLSVLATTVGVSGALLVAGGALLVTALVVLRHRWQGRRRLAASVAAAAFTVAAVLLPGRIAGPGSAQAAAHWAVLDETAIAEHVAAGRVVYVNVTADWCLTCKVNESLVLDTNRVRTRLDDADVIAMRGDWTRPDEQIARFLASFGRYGIPLDAVYGPAMPDGEALPELLTTEIVVKALDRAGDSAR